MNEGRGAKVSRVSAPAPPPNSWWRPGRADEVRAIHKSLAATVSRAVLGVDDTRCGCELCFVGA